MARSMAFGLAQKIGRPICLKVLVSSTLANVMAASKIAILADYPLHFLPHSPFPPPAGHYATWLPQLAKSFEEERAWECHWVVLDSAVSVEQKIQSKNQIFHVLPSWKRRRAATLFMADRHKIHQKIREIDPDLVHGWGNENVWGWATAASGRKNIFSIQGLLGFYGKVGHQGLRNRLMALIESVVLRKAMMVTAESPWTAGQVKRLYGRNDLKVVEYGVPLEFFEADYVPDMQKPYAVMIGTADFRKGIDFAIKLFSRPELAHVHLKVIGGVAPFGEKWKKISPANIEWLGRKNQAEIIRLMAGATCLVLPTRGDTGPTVAKEARVIGLPLVASPHGGHIQYLEHEKNGFVFGLDEPESWSQAIRYLFHDLTRAQAMGKVFWEKHRELLRPEKTAKAFAALYAEVLGRPPGKRT